MSRQAEQSWQRIIAKGTSVDPGFEVALHLQPGAKEEDFRSVEHELGVILPEEMKALYRIHDGQIWDIGGAAFVRNLTLTPLVQVKENWAFLQEEFEPDELEPDIDDEIKPLLWNAKWIPIAENGGGDYLCLDTDPASSGNVGQVLYFWHDWGKRSVEASGLFAFLELCIEEEADD
ncbi:SMI1/KNR4 family protein [Paenibacillus sp. DCT19]|uniref:SMI1/KNR4 family protein n=1 Tax=Paenibacillus sp. DCT19 TaxID=2211212 RepID=UPI000FE2058E|nr:SMI1/KNR4 family protein [Paenibacillus sp. DCT19]